MKEFEKLVTSSLSNVLNQIFGIKASELIMGSIIKNGRLSAKPGSFEDIDSHLEKLFNSKISSILLRIILKQLHDDIQQEYLQVEEYFDFLDSIYKTKLNIGILMKSKEFRVFN